MAARAKIKKKNNKKKTNKKKQKNKKQKQTNKKKKKTTLNGPYTIYSNDISSCTGEWISK